MCSLAYDIKADAYGLWRQALSGDPDGALARLKTVHTDDLTILGADLLARLYVRQGQLKQARLLWQRILQTDPGYAPAVTAMNKLRSHWLTRAVAKRFTIYFGTVTLLLFALLGIATLMFRNGHPQLSLLGAASIVTLSASYLAGLSSWMYMTNRLE